MFENVLHQILKTTATKEDTSNAKPKVTPKVDSKATTDPKAKPRGKKAAAGGAPGAGSAREAWLARLKELTETKPKKQKCFDLWV